MMQFSKRSSTQLLVGTLFTALLFVTFLLIIRKYDQNDLTIYYTYSLNMIKGQFPYTDFKVEYPPLALLPMVLPQLPSVVQQQSLQQYIVLFFIQNAFLSFWMGKIILNSNSTTQINSQSQKRAIKVLIVFAVLIAINLTIIFARYDVFAALLTLFALWSTVEQRPIQASIWFGLGVAAKLYPIVLLPVFCLYYLTKRDYQNCLRFLGGIALTIAVVFLPFVIIGKSQFLYFLSYHKLRGLHLETLPAGILLLIHKLGFANIQFELNYGAYHLTSPIADPILRILPIANLVLFALVILCCFNHFRREYQASREISQESLVLYSTLTLLVFIISAKVFSAQYIVWLLPFLLLFRLTKTYLFLITSISISNTLVYPLLFSRLLNLQLLPVLVLNLRNILIVVLTVYLFFEGFSQLIRYKQRVEGRSFDRRRLSIR
jgi:hypothetical protein